MTSIREAAGYTEFEWDRFGTPDARWQAALSKLRLFARRRGVDHKDTETLAVALLEWQKLDPFQRYAVLNPITMEEAIGEPPARPLPLPFVFAWQHLVAQVAVP